MTAAKLIGDSTVQLWSLSSRERIALLLRQVLFPDLARYWYRRDPGFHRVVLFALLSRWNRAPRLGTVLNREIRRRAAVPVDLGEKGGYSSCTWKARALVVSRKPR